MENGTAQRVVLISAVMTYSLGWFNSVKNGNDIPSARFLIGTSVTFGALSVLADFAPEVAGPLALAVLTTALFTEGQGVLEYLNGGGETQSQPTTSKTPVKSISATANSGTEKNATSVPRVRRTPGHSTFNGDLNLLTNEDVGQIPGLTYTPAPTP